MRLRDVAMYRCLGRELVKADRTAITDAFMNEHMSPKIDEFAERFIANLTFIRPFVFVGSNVRLEIARGFTLPSTDRTQTRETNA